MTTNDITNSVSTPQLLLQHGYHYIEQIGEGSNGKTYKAKNLKTGEIVAIKALKFTDNLKNYELFEREAQTLKSIHTPGTPVFYDYITSGTEFTECWLVQEYIKGESLFDKLEKGETFSEKQTLEILKETAQIVLTLQTMYTPPIIHRDIKPSNILVRDQPKGDTKLCLIDFGAVANPQRRALNSTVAGTVGYMAPEQLLGDCTIQSDYYALGATALHLLTGINPSSFHSDGFTLQFEKTLKQKVPKIHKETIALLHTLLAENPGDRPKDARELILLIEKTLSSFNYLANHLNSNYLSYILLTLAYHIPWTISFLIIIGIIFVVLARFLCDHYLGPDAAVFVVIPLVILGLALWVLHGKLSVVEKDKKAELLNTLRPLRRRWKRLNKNSLTSDLSINSETFAVIRNVIPYGDYYLIESTVQEDRKFYTIFTIADDVSSYRIGSKIRL